jgi:cytochrome b561
MTQPATSPVTRYHPVIVALHWLLTVLIIGSLMLGYFKLAPMTNTDPQKIAVLRVHMAGGMVILVLMAIRLLVRLLTSRPAASHPVLNRWAVLAHYAFYALVVLMAGTGLATAVISGLNLIVFGGSADPLPPSLLIYPTRIAHGYVAAALAALIALHIAAALYHQFVLRDGLFRRMWFGQRTRIKF